jgi:transposase
MSVEIIDRTVGMLISVCSITEAAEANGRPVSTIHHLYKKYLQTGTTQDRPCSGRPPVLSVNQKRIIYRKACAALTIEYSKLIEEGVFVNADGTASKPPSKSTLYCTLKRRGLTNYRRKVRPKPNRRHALKRMKFCRDYRQFPWGCCMLKFSDGCSVQKGSGHNQECCFRCFWGKWKKEMISQVRTSRKPAQMVWASIWVDEREYARKSDLVIMDCNFNAPKHEYSSQGYLEALRRGLLPYLRCTQLFMQDNARIHTSRVVRQFLTDHYINTITWPPYSPDLNPIEHLWWHLKKCMHKFYPQYNNCSVAEKEWESLCEVLKQYGQCKRLDLCWPQWVHFGSQEHHRTPWNSMESHGTSWNPTEPHEIPQNLMESHGRFWNMAESSGC